MYMGANAPRSASLVQFYPHPVAAAANSVRNSTAATT